MYKVVSLFSGCGGADQGIIGDFIFNKKKYERLPFELVYATDIDQKALNSHMKNFKCENVVCKDICETKSDEIPNCDIVVGGFPCQSFSTVNPTKDPFDDRANLYKQMVRVVRDKQPKVFIAENVDPDREHLNIRYQNENLKDLRKLVIQHIPNYLMQQIMVFHKKENE